jgi:hypothetical protein
MDRSGRQFWIVTAERSDAGGYSMHADQELPAFLELESAIRTAQSGRPSGNARKRAVTKYFSTMKAFFSIILAVAVSISPALAKHGGHGGHGGYHGKPGKHFSSVSPRGGHKFNRNALKFSRGKWSGSGKWSGGRWNGGRWNGGYWSGGSRFISIGGFGYPYYSGWYPSWGWSVPYSYSYYSYYPYRYYPAYWYDYDYYNCSVSRRQFFGP